MLINVFSVVRIEAVGMLHHDLSGDGNGGRLAAEDGELEFAPLDGRLGEDLGVELEGVPHGIEQIHGARNLADSHG